MTTVEYRPSGREVPHPVSQNLSNSSSVLAAAQPSRHEHAALLQDLVSVYMGEPRAHGSSQSHLKSIDNFIEGFLGQHGSSTQGFAVPDNVFEPQSPVHTRTLEEAKLHLALTAVCVLRSPEHMQDTQEVESAPWTSFVAQTVSQLDQFMTPLLGKRAWDSVEPNADQSKANGEGESLAVLTAPMIIAVDVPGLHSEEPGSEVKLYTIPDTLMKDVSSLAKTHKVQRISGHGMNCWMRAAWAAILPQVPTKDLDHALLKAKVPTRTLDAIGKLSVQALRDPRSILTRDGRIAKHERELFKATQQLLSQHIDQHTIDDKSKKDQLNLVKKAVNTDRMGHDDHVYTLMHILGADIAINSRYENSYKILDHEQTSGVADEQLDQNALSHWLSTKPIIHHNSSGNHFSLLLPVLGQPL